MEFSLTQKQAKEWRIITQRPSQTSVKIFGKDISIPRTTKERQILIHLVNGKWKIQATASIADNTFADQCAKIMEE